MVTYGFNDFRLFTVVYGYIASSIILFVSVRHVLLFLEHNAGNDVMVNSTLQLWHQTE